MTWDGAGQQLRFTIDESKRLDLARALVRVFCTDVPMLPVYFDVDAGPVAQRP